MDSQDTQAFLDSVDIRELADGLESLASRDIQGSPDLVAILVFLVGVVSAAGQDIQVFLDIQELADSVESLGFQDSAATQV